MRFSIRPFHLKNQRSRRFVSRHLTLLSVLLVLGVAVSGLTWGRLGGASSAERETHRVRTGGPSAVLAPVKASNVASMPSTVTTLAPTTVTVNAGPDIDAANNDYRRIQNALNAAISGDTIILSGTFDFTAPFAAAAWAAGNDGVAGNSDDYEVSAPRGINNFTLTANSLGSATIQGPGDLPALDLESFLVFDASLAPGGGAQGCTISNLRILDFDLSIGMFAVGVSDYNNTTITNNFIRIPNDLNATVAPGDTLQNIGLHFSFGTNQSITGNSFQTPGDGVSDTGAGNFSSIVVMQSNQTGGAIYNGLTISNNVIHVLNAQSANPEVILGIWENGHAHTSNITVSNNSFLNDAVGNSPSLNLERAFRVTSHSGASSLVKYDSNTVNGANIGFQWITGSNFAGNQAVVLTGNQITNSATGVLVQSNGIAHFENNVITGSGSGGGIHLITGMLTGSPAAFPANLNSIYRSFVSGGSGDGILIDATAGTVSQLSQNDLSGNTGFGLHNLSAPAIVAESNWWGNNLAANVAATVSGNADFDPWLASGTDISASIGFQPFIYATTTTAANLTTLAGTAAADTGSMLNTSPVTLTMDGDTGFVPVAQLLNVSIQLGNSDDVFTLGQTGITTNLDGGAANDTLVGTNIAQTWNITGANSGNIPGATSSFINVESLRGGTAADSFVFGAAGSVGQTIDGNLATDTLNNSAIPGSTITPTGPGTLDGSKGTATGVGVGFDNINGFFRSPSSVSGTKTVSGTFAPNGSITYTVVLSNSSAFAQLDNPGNEFTDVLPAGLALVSASATGGTAAANTGTNTATWSGSIAGGGSVTVIITATINSNAGGTTISNQGTIFYDADGNGTNESSRPTDDPAVGGASDPTNFSVKSNQTITFGALANKNFGDPDFAVSATASSSLVVSFTASGQCTVAVNTVHITAAGSCTITASQAGNSNFNAAPDVPQTFPIANRALIALSQSNYTVNESAGFVTITVNRTGDLSIPVNVDYATDDTGAPIQCAPVSGNTLASSRCDFGLTLGTLKFAANETQKTFVIPVTQDSYNEGPEMFTVNLSNLTGTGAAFATPSSATVTINDSAAPAPNASDDTNAFVRQQYRDFLNRESDAAGLAFWTNEITSCGANPACIDIKRQNVSAAFFLSIEFQTTGNLVRSFYVAALNRPLTNNMPGFVEFERDTQALQRGVIVDPNNNAWQAILNANRGAFMSDFVTRAEFVGLYPTTDTPTQYVNKLYLHAGVSPATPAEGQAAIDEFGGSGTAADPGARGRALLRITQNAAFQQREMNRSFVQMEYFGYLRRNPNDAPDTDFTGYNFWVTKLNAAGGNFIQAEMVKAFIISTEYRQRFGPN